MELLVLVGSSILDFDSPKVATDDSSFKGSGLIVETFLIFWKKLNNLNEYPDFSSFSYNFLIIML